MNHKTTSHSEAHVSTEPVSPWVRAAERMPEYSQRILGHVAPRDKPAMTESEGPEVFRYFGPTSDGRHEWANQNSFNYLRHDWTVIWWMPVPEDPCD